VLGEIQSPRPSAQIITVSMSKCKGHVQRKI
jgi:hypothetical protein